MPRESDAKTGSQSPVTDVPTDAYSLSDGFGKHKLEPKNDPSLRRGIQRTFNSLTPSSLDSAYYTCAQETEQEMNNKNNNNDNEDVYQILDVNGKYVKNKKQKHCEKECCKEEGPSCTEAGNCELNRTIQLMEAPSADSNRQGLNLVKSNLCWSGLARISWNCLFTLTLCIISMFVINQPVAAERPFHHRDMRDEAILNPTTSHVSVDNLQAATEYLIQYGYLACNAQPTSETRNHERSRSGRTKRQINFRRFPEVTEGGDPEPQASRCTHTSLQVHESLRNFQRAYKLPVTGILDQHTLQKMNLKRCGNADVIGANLVFGDDSNESSLHRAVKRSVGNLKRAKRKATLLIEEKRRQRALEAIQEKYSDNAESKPKLSSLLSRLLLPKSKPKLSQSASRRLQMIEDYQKQFEEEESIRDPNSNKRRGGFISSKHKEAVILDASVDQHRRKRSAQTGFGTQRFNLDRQDCIRWRLLTSGYSQRLPVGSVRAKFNVAFRMWAEVTPLCFVEDFVSSADDLDIAIAFGNKQHQGCPFNFDGPSGVLAHNVNLGSVQHIHLDDSEPWKLDRGEDGVNLLKIAAHEIGHVLGLNHIGRNYSVMFAMYVGIPQFQDFELGWEDRKEVQNIYGVCAGKFDVIFDWVQYNKHTQKPFFNSYFFRNERYWMYENRYNRTRYGDPLLVFYEWRGVPSAIDSYVQLIYVYHYNEGETVLEIHTMFFRGDYVYYYDDENDHVRPNGTVLIRDAFPALGNVTEVYSPERYPHAVAEHIPGNLDAVVWSLLDERLLFFKDEWVYTMDPVVGACCEEKMLFRDKFPNSGLDGYLDTAFYAHFQEKLFMFKGDDVYEAVEFGKYHNPTTTPLPRHNNTHVQYVDKWYNIWYDICEVSATTEYSITSEPETLELSQVMGSTTPRTVPTASSAANSDADASA